MPIYEFECSDCHQVTEAMQKFSDQPLTVCPRCGGHLSKLISMNSFQLKGGGWYATDYAKKPSPATSKPATSPAECSKKDCAANCAEKSKTDNK
ncbi:MAG: zinc ribbon domain-containing protein [Deltaproteobacteria bacterium]|nr:zinc ribbon domain-containing protein [Deltaproteobacteria bacterium]